MQICRLRCFIAHETKDDELCIKKEELRYSGKQDYCYHPTKKTERL